MKMATIFPEVKFKCQVESGDFMRIYGGDPKVEIAVTQTGSESTVVISRRQMRSIVNRFTKFLESK